MSALLSCARVAPTLIFLGEAACARAGTLDVSLIGSVRVRAAEERRRRNGGSRRLCAPAIRRGVGLRESRVRQRSIKGHGLLRQRTYNSELVA